jgi:hypothetical protein
MSAIGDAQQRAIDDAQVAWHAAIAALDTALSHAENLHDARLQLLADDDFWQFRGAQGGMTDILTDLIEAVTS